MLIARIFLNNIPLEDILIHNKGNHVGDLYEYEVVSPDGYNSGKRDIILNDIKHMRKDGYRKLLIQVLRNLEENKVEAKVI